MKFAAIALIAAALQQPPATEFAWDCKINSANVCDASAACNAIKPSTSSYIYPTGRTYYRCPIQWRELAECDRYNVAITTSGTYTNIELSGRAAFARVGPGLSFTEVVTLMDRVFVNHGMCISAPPPLTWLNEQR